MTYNQSAVDFFIALSWLGGMACGFLLCILLFYCMKYFANFLFKKILIIYLIKYKFQIECNGICISKLKNGQYNVVSTENLIRRKKFWCAVDATEYFLNAQKQ